MIQLLHSICQAFGTGRWRRRSRTHVLRPSPLRIGHLCLGPLEFCSWRLTKPAVDAKALRCLEQYFGRGSFERIYF